MTVPIISEEVFNSMDRNKDGFVSKGELKLAQQKVSMKKLASVIDSLDADHDGKLTMEELKTGKIFCALQLDFRSTLTESKMRFLR